MKAEPVRRRPQHSDEKLLGAAAKIFASSGFEAATLQLIADESGTTKPTLYSRFRSKEGLYLAAVERESKILSTRLLATYAEVENEPLEDLVRSAVREWFEYAFARDDGFRLLFVVAARGPHADKVETLRMTLINRIVDLVRGGAPNADRVDELTVRMLAAMIFGACVEGALRMSDEDLDAGQATTIATDFILGTYLAEALAAERP